MRVGIVTIWWNRGQATVSRYLRSIFDALGHKTFVLARPTRDDDDLPAFISREDVWNQKDVTYASNHFIPLEEYVAWVKKNSIEVAFFDQNTEFSKIAMLRSMGVKTIGRFVWEYFGGKHARVAREVFSRPTNIKAMCRFILECFGNVEVKGAKKAFDIVYSLTRCEQSRYAGFGIDSPWIQWGCHPELVSVNTKKRCDGIYFYFPGGYQGGRKPLRKTIEAFLKVKNPRIRLIIKAQGERSCAEKINGISDERIIKVTQDMPAKAYYDLLSSCHVCLAPSRWEGLGQHLYEAISFGIPIITNDIPPHNEVVKDRYNGLLVKSHKAGFTPSGIPSYDPDVDDLARAIEESSDPVILEGLSENTVEMQRTLSWDKTIEHARRVFGL